MWSAIFYTSAILTTHSITIVIKFWRAAAWAKQETRTTTQHRLRVQHQSWSGCSRLIIECSTHHSSVIKAMRYFRIPPLKSYWPLDRIRNTYHHYVRKGVTPYMDFTSGILFTSIPHSLFPKYFQTQKDSLSFCQLKDAHPPRLSCARSLISELVRTHCSRINSIANTVKKTNLPTSMVFQNTTNEEWVRMECRQVSINWAC